MYSTISFSTLRKHAFTLVEVVLALGIFLVTVLALVGLLGPTLKSVSDVESADEVISVVNSLNAFLQNSQEIAGTSGNSKFREIYDAVNSGNHATVFVFKSYQNSSSDVIGLTIGFDGETQARVNAADFRQAAGQIFRVVLSASSVLPNTARSASRNGDGVYTLSQSFDSYDEGYFAMEVRIYGREEDMVAVGSGSIPNPSLNTLNLEEPIFTYNTAIVR